MWATAKLQDRTQETRCFLYVLYETTFNMSNCHLDAVWQDATLKGSARLVMLALANHADKNTDICWPSVQRLADMANISVRQVQRTLRQLTEQDYIEQLTTGHGRGNSANYRMLLKGDITTSPISDEEKVTPGVIKGDILAQKVTPGVIKGDIAMSPEPYRTVNRTVEGTARATPQPPELEPQTPPPKKPKYKNREHLRAQMNVSEAAKIGMDKRQLREWADWVLEQSGQLAIADVADDDSRIGKAQQTAINLWRMGFNDSDGLLDIRDWLDQSFYSPPFFSKNLENAASAICAGTAPPGGKQSKQQEIDQIVINAATGNVSELFIASMDRREQLRNGEF